jgi:hypothetical protein
MPLDPIVTSVIQHRLHAIVEEMGEAMLRSSAISTCFVDGPLWSWHSICIEATI